MRKQPLTDTTPRPAFLRGMQNQAWTVSGAISELVDNSFGAGRGDATLVHLTWYAKDRVLTVLDNGQGMDDIARLFQLGNTIGRHVGDIGEYGSGGTMALIWLGRRVNVWTLRKHQVAIAAVDWDRQIQHDAFPRINSQWYRATKENTPSELLAVGHGTYIVLKFPPKRAVIAHHIRAELAATYAPAIRQGRKLIWQTAAHWDQPPLEGASDGQPLGEPLDIPDAVPLKIEFELDDQRLTAHGKAGRIEGLGVSQSSIAIGFGPRLLLRTKECYHLDDETYSGIGLTGYLDLDDGWQPFLSTTKNAIDDSRAWTLLMGQLFVQLRPLLEACDRAAHSVLFDELALDLQKMFDGSIKVTVPGSGPEQSGSGGSGSGSGSGPNPPPPTPDPWDPTDPIADTNPFRLHLEERSDREMEGLLCRVEVQSDRMTGSINEDHPFVKAALAERPPNRLAFNHMVVHAVANGLLDQQPELLKKIFDHVTQRRFEAQQDAQIRRGLLVRLLMDRVRAA